MRRRSTACGWVAALLIAAASIACKPKPPKDPGAKPAADLSVPLVFHAAADSNGGRPLYLVVRATTQKSFVEDDYSTVAALVVAPDATVLDRIVVFPGENRVVQVPVAKLPASIGVYGLFNAASGESWKLMFEDTRAIELVIGSARLDRAEPPRR